MDSDNKPMLRLSTVDAITEEKFKKERPFYKKPFPLSESENEELALKKEMNNKAASELIEVLPEIIDGIAKGVKIVKNTTEKVMYELETRKGISKSLCLLTRMASNKDGTIDENSSLIITDFLNKFQLSHSELKYIYRRYKTVYSKRSNMEMGKVVLDCRGKEIVRKAVFDLISLKNEGLIDERILASTLMQFGIL